MKQKEYFGYGSISQLSDILRDVDPQQILLVTGKKSFSLSGVDKNINSILKQHNVIHFKDFDWIPIISDVKAGIDIFRRNKCDFVIAIGGGSVIDMAKLINIFSAQKVEPEEYIFGKEMTNAGKPLVAVPTTAGSGSEATHFAVVYINRKKFSVAEQRMLPTYSIIDPQLTMNLPARITAFSGMDALSQAIESFWSLRSTKASRDFAKTAIELILQSLGNAVNDPDIRSRTSMSRAANLAGKAINLTTTTAPHAVSYPLTTHFGIPHGHAVALTLGEFIVFNSTLTLENINDANNNQLLHTVQKNINELLTLLNVTSSDEARRRISNLMYEIGLETKLSKLGVQPQDIGLICNNVNYERIANNPRRVTETDLVGILSNIM